MNPLVYFSPWRHKFWLCPLHDKEQNMWALSEFVRHISVCRHFQEILNGPGATPKDVMIGVEFARCRHFLKAKPLYEVIAFLAKHMEILVDQHVPGHKTVQRHLQSFTGVTLTVLYKHRTKEETYKKLVGVKAIPKSKFPRKIWRLVDVVAEISIPHFLNIHQARHKDDVEASELDVSYDGVIVTKSCGRSFEVCSIKFTNCRQVCTFTSFPSVDSVIYRWREIWRSQQTKPALFPAGLPSQHRNSRERVFQMHDWQRGDETSVARNPEEWRTNQTLCPGLPQEMRWVKDGSQSTLPYCIATRE